MTYLGENVGLERNPQICGKNPSLNNFGLFKKVNGVEK
jgi:hypothetical protein